MIIKYIFDYIETLSPIQSGGIFVNVIPGSTMKKEENH